MLRTKKQAYLHYLGIIARNATKSAAFACRRGYTLGMGTRFAGLICRFATGALAKASGIPGSTISAWKTSRSMPLPEYFEAITAATGIPLEQIAQAIADDKAARSNARRVARKSKKITRRHKSAEGTHAT
jgi:transcriptional regulator with XRE-family HTH domain